MQAGDPKPEPAPGNDDAAREPDEPRSIGLQLKLIVSWVQKIPPVAWIAALLLSPWAGRAGKRRQRSERVEPPARWAPPGSTP
jgi:hypothetical protein